MGRKERKQYLSKLHRRRTIAEFQQGLDQLQREEDPEMESGGEADLWMRNGLRCIDLCVVCSEPAASHLTGPHGVLSRINGRNRSSKLVAVHDRCTDRAQMLAQEQGYEWMFPPPPNWGRTGR